MLIGLTGRKQAGKDTACLRLAHILGDTVVERMSFADLLYESAAASLGVTVEELQTWKSDPSYRVAVGQYDRELGFVPYLSSQTVREYLQHYGTEAHRGLFGPDFWVERIALEHEGRVVVVTDVRFENEARAVQVAGGAVVEVIGPSGRTTSDTHASEVPLPEELVDATIMNVERDDGFVSLDRTLRVLLRFHLDAQRYTITVPTC